MKSVVYVKLEEAAVTNPYYRRVITTTPQMQVVLMSLVPGQNIGMESHRGITQFFRVEKGEGLAQMDYGEGMKSIHIKDGDMVVIPPGAMHNISNTSRDQDLKLYTIYSPPNHPSNRLDVTKPSND